MNIHDHETSNALSANAIYCALLIVAANTEDRVHLLELGELVTGSNPLRGQGVRLLT